MTSCTIMARPSKPRRISVAPSPLVQVLSQNFVSSHNELRTKLKLGSNDGGCPKGARHDPPQRNRSRIAGDRSGGSRQPPAGL
jgi:hypothetical protein